VGDTGSVGFLNQRIEIYIYKIGILHRCFLPSLAPFCQAVSEEKIFLNSNQSETRIALGVNICWWNGTKWRNFIEDLT
jgi:hypothetical protein